MDLQFTILLFSVFGVIASVKSHSCSLSAYRYTPQETRLFGVLPWSYIGVLGYTSIAFTSTYPELQRALITGVFFVTPFLVLKAMRLRRVCAMCLVCWGINTSLICLVLIEWLGLV